MALEWDRSVTAKSVGLNTCKIFVNKFVHEEPEENIYKNQTIEGEFSEINLNEKDKWNILRTRGY